MGTIVDPATGHSYSNNQDTTCDACEHERELASEEPENNFEEPQNSKLSSGEIVAIATGGTATVGVGGFSIFWFVIKKKKWIDLISIFHK